jgi:hypothetical protein
VIEGGAERRGGRGFTDVSFHPGAAGELLREFDLEIAWTGAELREQRRDDPSFLPKQGYQQVLRGVLGMASLTSEALPRDDGFLGFNRQLIKIHTVTSKSARIDKYDNATLNYAS